MTHPKALNAESRSALDADGIMPQIAPEPMISIPLSQARALVDQGSTANEVMTIAQAQAWSSLIAEIASIAEKERS